MKISVLATTDAVADAAAGIVVETLTAVERPVLGLPTGRTPLALYAKLTAAALDWSRVRTFNLDEFEGVSPAAPESFRHYMDRHLFNAIGLPVAQIGFLRGDAADPDAECARYDRAIVEAGGIDLLICGLGTNGHIGFNEPGDRLCGPTHRSALQDDTRAANAAPFGGDVARVPTHALTMGMTAILQARRILVLATGSEKAAVVGAMCRGPLTTALPASWLQVHGAVEVLLDRTAAAVLEPLPARR